MTTKTGWWKLETTGDFDLDDTDRDHIANLVRQGYIQGQLIHEEEDNPTGVPQCCPRCGSVLDSDRLQEKEDLWLIEVHCIHCSWIESYEVNQREYDVYMEEHNKPL